MLYPTLVTAAGMQMRGYVRFHSSAKQNVCMNDTLTKHLAQFVLIKRLLGDQGCRFQQTSYQ
jgi:hypothetical protein